MTRRPVAISGIGCVCALGLGIEEVAAGLATGRDGIRPVTLFPTRGFHSSTAGQLPDGLAAAAAAVHGPARKWSRAAQAALVAIAEALERRPGFRPEAAVFATTSGAMDLGQAFFLEVRAGVIDGAAGRRVAGYPPEMPVRMALRALGLEIPLRIVSNACASGTNALGMGWRMLAGGAARQVIVGGYDTLSEFVFAGFDSLRASTAGVCRPFDADRDGLVLGEGAAAFLLESDGPLLLAGYGAATDGHHLTQPHPSGSGPALAMRRALETAGRDPAEVDYVNAHGTGTPQNDACEALAIGGVCPQAPVSSTKAATGHALGAAGAIEAAFCAVAIERGFLPATLNLREPCCALDIVRGHPRQARPRLVLSNSFGFGGANASVAITPCP